MRGFWHYDTNTGTSTASDLARKLMREVEVGPALSADPAWAEAWARAQAGRSVSWTYVREDGERLAIEGNGIRGSTGEVVGIGGTVELDPLQGLNAYSDPGIISAVASALPDILYVFDVAHRSNVWTNRQVGEVLGYSADEVREMEGNLMPRLAHPDDLPDILAHGDRLRQMRDGEVAEITYRLRHRDGRFRWLFSREVALMREPDGAVRRVLGVAQDVTARMAADQELRKARDLALYASQAKSRFLASMSHEIRTPLNGILGISRELMETTRDAEAAVVLEAVVHSGETLLRVLNDCLDLSRVEAGDMEIVQGPTDVAALLRDVVALNEAQARARGLNLRAEVASPLPLVLADSARLRQVLGNVVAHALRATSRGSVQLRAQAEPVGAEWDVTIEVEDTSAGVDAERLARIFDVGGRAEGYRDLGWGMGLTIARALAETMGGSLTANSTPGEGTCMTLRLSLPPTEPEPPEEEDATSVNLSVLLVEDHPINVLVARRMLERIGCRVDVAGDGCEAIRRCAERRYDAVLMDLGLPHCDGVEATRAIRLAESGSPVPIIAVTANAMDPDRAACEAAGMDGFVAKPYTLRELRRALLQAVPQ